MNLVATRIHGTVVFERDILQRAESFVSAARAGAQHVAVAVEVPVSPDGSLDSKGFDVIRKALESKFSSSEVTVLPVTNWSQGRFTQPLNALLHLAVSLQATFITYQSLDVRASAEVYEALISHTDRATLVTGAELPGHEFGQQSQISDENSECSRQSESEGTQSVPLNGVTCPWNTLATWRVSSLVRTGFLAMSDVPNGAGVEEVICVAAQQKLFRESAETKLLRLPDASVTWNTQFASSDLNSRHKAKMQSKIQRAATQMKALGWSSREACVDHIDASLPDSDDDSSGNMSAISSLSEEKEGELDCTEDCRTAVVLLTGAAGFIGSHTADALLSRGNIVVGVDNINDYYDVTQKEANLAYLHKKYPQGFTFIRGDITDFEVMKAIFEQYKPSYVVHLAAMAGVRYSLQNPLRYTKVNVDGTTCLLELSQQHHIKNFVYASSSSVYGESSAEIFSETDTLIKPVSPYAASKLATELLASTFSHLYSLPTSGLRFFTVYGPRGRPDMAPFIFLSRVLAGQEITRFGDGSTERDYTYIDDIVSGVIRSMDRPAPCEVYNLGNGRPVKLGRFIDLVGEVTRKTPLVVEKPMQPGDVMRTYANIDKARRLLGYDPKVPFEEGIRRTCAWFESRESA